MKRNYRELASIFSDSRLKPSRSFEKALKNKISGKSKKNHLSLARIGIVFGVALIIIGLSLFVPSSKVKDYVLIKDLYSKALADELPQDDNINFWSLQETLKYGPQAPLCSNTESGFEVTSNTLIYNNNTESAIFTRSTDPNIYPYMRYSNDSEILAYDEQTYFGGEKSSFVSQYLNRATLTDEKGNTLTDSATVEKKLEGDYTIFAKINTEIDDYKNFIDGCNNLIIKVYINASKGVFKGVDIYNTPDVNQATNENLSFSKRTNLETDSADNFTQVLDTFKQEGFDMSKAQETNLRYSNATELNKEAGYEFSYKILLLGKAKLTTIRDENGEITSYLYNFSKQPEVRLELFTNKSNVELDINKRIQSSAQTPVGDINAWTSQDPYFGTITARRVATIMDQTKYSLYATGTPYVVFVEVEAPIGLGESTVYDEYAPNFPIKIDDILTLSSVAIFKQNGEPPEGL